MYLIESLAAGACLLAERVGGVVARLGVVRHDVVAHAALFRVHAGAVARPNLHRKVASITLCSEKHSEMNKDSLTGKFWWSDNWVALA